MKKHLQSGSLFAKWIVLFTFVCANAFAQCPTITTQPADKGICAYDPVTFKVVASGTGVTYQWQVDLGDGNGFTKITDASSYSGFSTATLSLLSAQNFYNGRKYRCSVSGTGCATPVLSNAAKLKVGSYSLSITNSIPSAKVCPGSNATFTAVVSDTTNVAYQWQEDKGTGVFANLANSSVYSGVNTSTLTVNNVTSAIANYKYQLVINNGCTTAQSYSSTGFIIPDITFNAFTSQTTVCSGTNISFTTTPTDNNETITSKHWQEDQGAGFVNLADGGKYTGTANDNLSISNVTAAMSGYKYRMIATSACFPAGKVSGVGTITVNSTPVIITNPANTSVCDGANNTSLSVAVASGIGYTYQWQVNDGGSYSDIADTSSKYTSSTTKTLTINVATLAMNNYLYRCQVKSTGCNSTVSSGAGQLTVNSNTVSVSTQPVSAITSCPGTSTTISIGATGTNPAYQWQVDKGAGFTNLTADANHANVTAATLSLNTITAAMNGWKYKAVVSNVCANPVSSNNAVLTVIPGPGVAVQPAANVTAWNGSGTSFSFTGSGSNLAYKWQAKKTSDPDFANINDGAVYTNTTTPTLSITSTDATMSGTQYRCVVQSNDCNGIGAVTNTVTLTTSEVKLCMATVDATGKNQIIFEKPADISTIDSFKVYREGAVTNQYSLIGEIQANTLSIFTDPNADPNQQAYLYKLAVKDTKGVTSPLSASHKTMHLTINQGVGQTWNLIWNAYDGITVNTYNIYRGTDASNMTLINSVSGNITAYTDNNAPVVTNIFYQIEIIPAAVCNPTARTAAFSSARSNIAQTQNIVTSIADNIVSNKLVIYPNPAADQVSINGLTEASTVTIYDLSGHALKTVSKADASGISIEDLANGLYIIEVKNTQGTTRSSLVVE